ncbi:MAG: ASKHA domain-containing protein [Syntrophobacteraceae bacterium]
MPELTIKTAEGDRHIEFSPGQTLREVLDTTNFRVRSGCGGTGACGLCRVRIAARDAVEPTPVERIYLSDDQLASGMRLACQVTPSREMEVVVLNRDPVSAWRAISSPFRCNSRSDTSPDVSALDLPRDIERPYGVAVDLGTTHISVSFHDLLSGKWFAGRHGPNPQGAHGSDVMTRLQAASESPLLAERMQRQVVDAVGSAIFDVAAREGIGSEQVARLVLVANTAMLGLLSGRNHHLLLDPAHWMGPIDCLPESPKDLSRDWGIHPEASVEIMPPLAGFVGSDLLAGCVALDIASGDAGDLFIDFGTNSEIALWDGKEIWVTSAAGGPAFEGCGISCGMPAEPGAIYQVLGPGDSGNSPNAGNGFIVGNASAPDMRFRTIDDAKPAGLCGSGIVDLIACLVRSNKLTSIGRFAPGVSPDGLVFLDAERKLVLTKNDVDMFQRAKSAISAGIRVLLSLAGMGHDDLRRVYVGGAFGHFLNRENAVRVGLLPDMGREAVHLCGNIALGGCERLLMTSRPTELLMDLKNRTRIINLSHCDDFADFFLEGLYLDRWPQEA